MSKEDLKFASEEEAMQHLANVTGKKIIIASTDQDFVKAYIKAMLWSTTDNSDDTGGDHLDTNYDESDISPEFMKQIKEDCKDFVDQNFDYISENVARAGHDFWLTRNHHGAGFWDGDWEEEIEVDGKTQSAGDHLTEMSHAYGGVDPYVGDDGKIYA
jgi:hypothetical protein